MDDGFIEARLLTTGDTSCYDSRWPDRMVRDYGVAIENSVLFRLNPDLYGVSELKTGYFRSLSEIGPAIEAERDRIRLLLNF